MNDNTDALLARWKTIVENIVAFEYDCSFEWRGETDGSHDSYLEDLKRLELEAGEALQLALNTEGADRPALLERAGEVCRKMEAEGGWGASRCWASIANAR
jgi:hypothetical protein